MGLLTSNPQVFYSTMLPLLSRKEITVIFANIEDILLANTAFVSSLEERQKECRLYIDGVGDILLKHIPNMKVYLVRFPLYQPTTPDDHTIAHRSTV